MTEMTPVTEATAATATAKKAVPDAQIVTEVRHWTDRLFSFRCTRPAALRFRSGEFVMIGLMQTDRSPARKSRCCAPIPSPRRPGTKSWSSTRSRCPTAR